LAFLAGPVLDGSASGDLLGRGGECIRDLGVTRGLRNRLAFSTFGDDDAMQQG